MNDRCHICGIDNYEFDRLELSVSVLALAGKIEFAFLSALSLAGFQTPCRS